MSSSADRGRQTPPPERPVRWPLLVAAGLAIAVATGLLMFFVLGGRDTTAEPDPEVVLPTTPASPTVTGSDTTASEPATASPSTGETAGGGPTGATSIAPADLADVGFQRLNGVRLPVHPTAGPTVQEDGRAWGFERSPLGAVMAAFAISSRSAEDVGPSVFRPTISEQFTGDADDIQAFLQAAERAYERKRIEQEVPDGEPLNEPLFQYLGWSLDFYDGTNAEIRLLAQGPGGDGQVIDATFRTPMRWEGGDWRYVAPPNGDLNPWVATAFDESRFTMLEEVG